MRDILLFERGIKVNETLRIIDVTMNYEQGNIRTLPITRLIICDQSFDESSIHFAVNGDGTIEERMETDRISASFDNLSVVICMRSQTSRAWSSLIILCRQLIYKFNIPDLTYDELFFDDWKTCVVCPYSIDEFLSMINRGKENSSKEPTVDELDWKTRALLAEQKLASILALLTAI